MRRSIARLASVCALAIATAAFAGGAAANGGGQGGGGNDSGGGSYQKSDNGGSKSYSSQQGGGDSHSSDSSKSYSSGGDNGNGGDHKSFDQSKSYSKSSDSGNGGDHKSFDQSKSYSKSSDSGSGGDQKSYKTESKSSSDSAGVKPSNDTQKWTKTKVGDQPDVSKRYGNGQTAAEIAKSRGANGSVELTGPGNSQPHKVCGRDVHAVKSYDEQGNAVCGGVAGVEATVKTQKHDYEKAKKVVVVQAATDCSASQSTVKVVQSKESGSNQHGQFEGQHSDSEGRKSGTYVVTSKGDTGCSKSAGEVKSATKVEQAVTCTAPMVAVKVDDDDHNGKGDDDESSDHVKCVLPENATVPAVVVQQTPTCPAPMVVVTVTSETNQHGQFEGEHQDKSSTTTVLKPGEAKCVAPENVIAPTANNGSVGSVLVPPAAGTPATGTPATGAPANAAPNGSVAGVSGSLPATQGVPATASAGQQPAGGVAGAQATLNTPKHKGGVLGTVGTIAGTSLPFTGFPLWAAVLVAIALVAAGLMLRRRGTDAPQL